MAAPLTPTSPLASESFTLTLAAATVVELDPAPYSNTKEIVLLNTDAVNDMWIKQVSVVAVPGSAFIGLVGAPTAALLTSGPLAGDTVTINGTVLTAAAPTTVAAGAFVPNHLHQILTLGTTDFTLLGAASNTIGESFVPSGAGVGTGTATLFAGAGEFSVDQRATGSIVVNTNTLQAGDTIVFSRAEIDANHPSFSFTLTAVAGVRAVGSLTFQAPMGSVNAQAAEINAALQDSDISGLADPRLQLAISSVVGATVTLTAGDAMIGDSFVGADRWTQLHGTGGNDITITSTTAIAGSLATADFSGGLDAYGFQSFFQNGIALNIKNTNNQYAMNLARAISLNVPNFEGVSRGTGVKYPYNNAGFADAVATGLVGVAGNGLVIAESTGGLRIAVVTPTAGGVDALPAALALATSTVIPAGGSLTLNIGTEASRQPLATSAYWLANPGSGLGYVVQMAAGGPSDLNVTYVQG